MKVVLDTNVVVSDYFLLSAPVEIVRMAAQI